MTRTKLLIGQIPSVPAIGIDDRFGLQFRHITAALGRIGRDEHLPHETLASFVRYMRAIHASLAASNRGDRALARQGFEAFVARVGRQVGSGRRTIGEDDPESGR